MPRKAREKHPEAIYHIMCRSISEILLFRDEGDKEYYVGLLKRYSEKYNCSIYAYCMMDNHMHLQLDPKGYDVSKYMLCTNTAYVRYYNKKYVRHGHVFQGRFESRILDTQEYNLAVSAYIHNNAKDIEGFRGKEESYRHSSYGNYLGLRKEPDKLVDRSFVMGIFNIWNEERFAKRYFSFVSRQRDVEGLKEIAKKLSVETEYEYISGRKVILRDLPASKVISYISGKVLTGEFKGKEGKTNKKLREFKAITAYALKMLCGLGYKEICGHIYNITISGCARLCDRGCELAHEKLSIYSSIIEELSNNGKKLTA